MSLPRKILLAVAILIAVFVVTVGIFVATFDANRHRGTILAQLGRSVNRPVDAANLELTLFPLRLRLNQVRVQEDPGFAAGDFLVAQAVRFDFDLSALLGGDVKVEGIELVEPTLYLRQNAEGQWNVATLAATPAQGPPPPVALAPAPPPIRDWEMEKGTIVIERPGERPLQLTGVELEVSDLSLTAAFPFRVAVNFTEDSRIAAGGNFGPFNADIPMQSPLDAEIELENFRATSLAGLMTVPPRLAALGAISGKLRATSKPNEIHLAGEATLLGQEAAHNLALKLDATFPPDFSKLEWRDTRLDYRGASVATTGTATLSPAVDFKLNLNTSDADLVALAAVPPRLGVPLPMKIPGTGKATAELGIFGTPENWLLTGKAQLRELEIPLEGLSQPARIPAMELILEPQRITGAFTVTLEKNLNLVVGGQLLSYRTTPTVQAKVSGNEVPVEPLLALAQQFGVKLLGPGQKLSGFVSPSLELSGPVSEPKKMNYSGILKFRNLSLALPELPKPVSIPSLALEFNPQRLTAAPFAVALEPGVVLNVTAAIEDYRGAGRLAARITGDEVPIEPLLSLAARFGANPLGPGQKLTGRVRPALEVTGPFSDLAKLSYQGTFELRDAFLTTALLPEPLRIASAQFALTPTRISAEDFPLQIGQRLRAQASFRLDNYKAQGRLTARVTTESAELDALLALVRALGSDPLPGGQASGQVNATLDATGALGEKSPPLDISGKAQLSGARVKPQALTAPLVIDSAALEFTGSRLDVSSFQMAAAGSRVRGSLRVDNFDAPNARFDFRGDTLDVEALRALFGAAQPAPQPQRRSGLFSPAVVHAQTQADNWFAKLTARGRIEFERVRNGNFTLAPFASSVAIANQVVTCDPIDFGLYDGGGRGRLTIDLRGARPATEFNGLLRNVDANGLLSATSDSKNMLYGRLGGTVQVRFVGDDAAQMKQSARGKGQVTLVNGRLAQINLSRELILLGQVAGLRYEGRETPIEDMTTNFEIADGWVRTDDLTMRTPDMTTTAVGGFSLNDELAFQGTATFTEEASQRMLSSNPNPLGGLIGSVVGNVFVDEQGRVVIPFLLRGTFAQPRPTLDAARLAEMRLRRGTSPASPGGTLGDILDRIRKRKPQ
ncbi:MAG TPA: AsmA family protein [Candidatus Xenobia bacterium]|nr:AsmA family protein [Candidatus Xenobia bacterium]